jgi:hypothetical protein
MSSVTLKPYTWEHQDSKGILQQSELAIVRAHAAEVGPTWPEKGSPDMPQAVAELRAWEVRLLAAVWALSLEPSPPKGSSVVLFPEFGAATRWKSNQHKATAVLLLNTIVLLSDTKGGTVVGLNDPTHQLKTNGAGTDLLIEEAGNPYLAAFAVVVGAAAWVVCTTVVAQKASEVIDRQLARREDSQRLMASASSIIKIVEAHTAAEFKKGAALAMSEVERAAIDSLAEIQKTIAQKQDQPLPSPLPSSSDIGKSFKIGATGLAVAAVVAAVLYFSH